MDNQVCMSELERDKILQEHEKQMVKLENSLTLNKLQQQRMLEEKLAQKRQQQMEKLKKKQLIENKVILPNSWSSSLEVQMSSSFMTTESV